MPTYNMKNVETGEIVHMIFSFSERDELLEAGKYTQELSIATSHLATRLKLAIPLRPRSPPSS